MIKLIYHLVYYNFVRLDTMIIIIYVYIA